MTSALKCLLLYSYIPIIVIVKTIQYYMTKYIPNVMPRYVHALVLFLFGSAVVFRTFVVALFAFGQ